MNRGDHLIFESPLHDQVFQTLKDPCVPGICCRGESGFGREPVSWVTNHPDLAEVLEQWRASVSGVEPDRHVQVKNGLTSVRYPVELVESFLRVVREDL